jgi:hypothetical protein
MVDRRSVLKLGAASVAGAFVRRPAPLLGAARTDSSRLLLRGVFDARFEQGVAFSEELRRRNANVFSAGPDIARLWYGDLATALSEHAPIAGLTERATLFCLEELARSAGMRVAYRVDHLIEEHGNARHSAVGPASVMEAASKLTATSSFGREMAVLAAQWETSEPSHTAALKRTGPFSPRNSIALVSWLIA